MFIKRKDSRVILDIDSELGTCTPVFPLSFDCGDSQEHAELLARQLNKVIKGKLEKIARGHYERGWKDAKSKRRKDPCPKMPSSFS